MQDSSAIPVRRAEDIRQRKPDSALPALVPSGPRKLVRPPLPDGVAGRYGRTAVPPETRTSRRKLNAADSSHAEAFYFQKQIQGQTQMVFVLEEGEQIEGRIEWYDRDAIKVTHGGVRTLIYKSSIRYLYKAAEGGVR